MNGPAQPASLGDIVEIQSTFATQKEIKSAMIALRLAPSLKQAAEKAAAEDTARSPPWCKRRSRIISPPGAMW
jgi:hypothetical protein